MINNRSKQQRSFRKRSKVNRGRKPRRPQRKTNNKLAIYTDAGRFTPDRVRCKLIFNDITYTRTNASANAANWAYRSSAYDPDPLLGTGAMPGFVELANFYENYLVHSMQLHCEVGNQDVNSYVLGAWPSNIYQNNNSLTSSDLQEYASNRGGVRVLIPPVNAGPVRFVITAKGTQLFGRQFKTDQRYSANTSTNPSNMYGINVGFFNGTGGAIGFPVIISAWIIYQVEFFTLRQLES